MENLLNCKGKRFRAVIGDKEVEGKIQVEEGCVHLCQDKKCGAGCEDKLGYKGSWRVRRGSMYDLRREGVKDFQLLDIPPPLHTRTGRWGISYETETVMKLR